MRRWFFYLALSLTILTLTYIAVGRLGILLGLGLAALLIGLLDLLNEKQILKHYETKPLRGQDPWGLGPELQTICAKLGVAKPELHIKTSKSPQAYALGAGLKNGTIVLSTGLLDRMEASERRVVLVYQCLLLYRRKKPFLAFMTAILHGITLIGFHLDRFFGFVASHEKELGPLTRKAKLLSQALLAFFPISYTFLKIDRRAAEILGSSQVVAQTLWKLDALLGNLKPKKSLYSEHLMIVHPLTTSKKYTYFSSHPSLEMRIRQLVGQYPL